MKLFAHRMLFRVGLIALASITVLFAVRYRRFAYAMTWHCFNKASIRFGGHEVEISKLWWAAKIDRWGRISIFRAYKGSFLSEAKIEVSPASPGVVTEDDVEQSRVAHAFVSSMSRDPAPGWTYSVAILRAKSSTWYCIRNDEAIWEHHVFTILTCNAPRIPYSLYYQGPPEQEKEAESIFASFL